MAQWQTPWGEGIASRCAPRQNHEPLLRTYTGRVGHGDAESAGSNPAPVTTTRSDAPAVVEVGLWRKLVGTWRQLVWKARHSGYCWHDTPAYGSCA